MKKFLLSIIGISSILLGISAAHADDCEQTLFDNSFSCQREKTYSYCDSASRFGRSGPKLNLYENAYCDTVRDDEEDIYEIVAEQFKAEDPKINADRIKTILISKPIDGSTPPALYARVKTAYDSEKITYQTKESLKSNFKSGEMWSNGTLDDSPFDLVVDLNLIEIVLFGGRANWVDDVWKWPKDSANGSKNPSGSGTGTGTTPGGGTDDGGTTGTTPPGSGTNPDDYECVPTDNPFGTPPGGPSNPPATPDPGVIPPGCGNGKIENNEECDDGNNKAGDGCSESCRKEDAGSLSCKDNEAVTFKKFTPKKQNTSGKTGGTGTSNPPATTPTTPSTPTTEIPLNCPPGSTPTKKPTTQGEKEARTPQAANYPGPFVGGVLKNYPPSAKSKCAPDEVYTTVSSANGSEGICLPSQYCSDFESARKFLFGNDYASSPTKKAAAESLDLSVCVKVTKVKRPESPYPISDGCIDCNILAMNDIMSKLVAGNVTPQINSMQSWGSSNRWGPTVSFNINVIVKAMVNPIFSPKYDPKAIPYKEQADKAAEQARQDAAKNIDPNNDTASPSVARTENATDIQTRDQENKARAELQYNNSLKYYSMADDANASRLMSSGLISKLRELRDSFNRLQNYFIKLSTSSLLDKKDKCSTNS